MKIYYYKFIGERDTLTHVIEVENDKEFFKLIENRYGIQSNRIEIIKVQNA